MYHLVTIFIAAGIKTHIPVERTLRLGKWKQGAFTNPRPLAVKFINPSHRDAILDVKQLIDARTGNRFEISPDNKRNWSLNEETSQSLTGGETSSPKPLQVEVTSPILKEGESSTSEPLLRTDITGSKHPPQQVQTNNPSYAEIVGKNGGSPRV